MATSWTCRGDDLGFTAGPPPKRSGQTSQPCPHEKDEKNAGVEVGVLEIRPDALGRVIRIPH